MRDVQQLDFSYFPGCSLATTAAEANRSLMQAARLLGLNLIELEDWNCCGSSSAQTMCKNLSLGMAARNLSLAPAGAFPHAERLSLASGFRAHTERLAATAATIQCFRWA